ncbi:MAG: CoA-binding domain protein [Solirubrobacterales bacterium]|nr:CoA-binding domain protein [Solirubrobacterales bacterium]
MSGSPSTLLDASGAVAACAASQPELVYLRDGSLVTIRATREGDEISLRLFLSGLCPEARRLRFFTGAVDTASAAHLAADTTAGHHGLVARDEAGVIVGHAIYVQLDRERAEVAVAAADHVHGRGLGTILIVQLAALAERSGIAYFVAEVLCENRAMLDVFREGSTHAWLAATDPRRGRVPDVQLACRAGTARESRNGMSAQP